MTSRHATHLRRKGPSERSPRATGPASDPGSGPRAAAAAGPESPLLWLARRRGADGEPLIGAAAFAAGERLRADMTLAGSVPSVTMRWDGQPGGGDASFRQDPTDRMVAAGQRCRQALAAVGPDFAGLLVDFCVFLKGLEEIERDRRWPPRSAKVVIRLALGALARHYGYDDVALGRGRHRRLRGWQADGARPDMGDGITVEADGRRGAA
jgi:hypothetical protein